MQRLERVVVPSALKSAKAGNRPPDGSIVLSVSSADRVGVLIREHLVADSTFTAPIWRKSEASEPRPALDEKSFWKTISSMQGEVTIAALQRLRKPLRTSQFRRLFAAAVERHLDSLDAAEMRAAAESAIEVRDDRHWLDLRYGILASGEGSFRRVFSDPLRYEWRDVPGSGDLFRQSVSSIESPFGSTSDAFAYAVSVPHIVGTSVISKSLARSGEQVLRLRYWRLAGDSNRDLARAHDAAEADLCEMLREEYQGIAGVYLLNDRERSPEMFGHSDVYFGMSS